jgi:hypothetical protein
MNTDESKPISAADIVKEPQIILGFLNQYILVRDMSPLSNYKNLIEAINILADYGWESQSIAADASGYMYALVRNSNYKQKNMADK